MPEPQRSPTLPYRLPRLVRRVLGRYTLQMLNILFLRADVDSRFRGGGVGGSLGDLFRHPFTFSRKFAIVTTTQDF